MKKTLILASLIAFTLTPALAAENAAAEQQPAVEVQKTQQQDKRMMKKNQFEQRLKLTDEQKAKAKELRMKNREEMKPIIEQIKAKHQEAEAVKRSRISVEMQQEKLAQIRAELKDLHKQAHELRMKNMQDFESLLTKKQKKELAKMKKEGRKQFEKNHKRMPANPEFRRHMGPGPQIPNQPPVEK